MQLSLVTSHSFLEIDTEPEGLLQRAAHRLRFGIKPHSGTGELSTDHEKGSAELQFIFSDLTLSGTLDKHHTLNQQALNSQEHKEIMTRVYQDVFNQQTIFHVSILHFKNQSAVHVLAKDRKQNLQINTHIEPNADNTFTVKGHCQLSLEKMGIKPIYGPMKLFKIKDTLDIHYCLLWRHL